MRRLLLVLAAVAAVLLSGSPAWAHAELIAADPAEGTALPTAPAAVTLTFSQPLDPGFATIVVSDAARQPVPSSAPAVDGVRGTVTIGAGLDDGTYTVAYRVVSVDGHTVQGSYVFSVGGRAPPSAVVVAASPGGVPRSVLFGLGAAGVILAAVAAYLYASGRRRAAAVQAPK